MKNTLIIFLAFWLTIPTSWSLNPPIVYVAGDGTGDYNCDGTSDQFEINQALDFVLADPNYTTVYLKGANTFWINEPILISSNCILKGDADARVQVVDNAGWPSNKPLIGQKGAEYWVGGANEGDLGAQIYGNSTDLLTNVEIAGFELTAGIQNAPVGSWYYILMLFHLVDNVAIHDMNLNESYGDFIRMLGNSWEVSQDVSVFSNFMQSSGHDGLYFAGISNLEAYDNEILQTRTNDAIRFEECKNVNIHDNTIGNSLTDTPSGYAGILLSNAGEYLGPAEIYNNFVYGKAGAIVLESGTTKAFQNGVHIHHNKIFKAFDNTAGGDDYLNGGIHIHGAHNTLIEFNTIDGSQKDGIVFELGNGNETGYLTTVQNNIIVNCDNYGISNLSNDHSFVCENNDVYNCTNGFYNNTTSSTDIHSEPLLVTDLAVNDPNLVDLHLKSEAGHWDGLSWVNDAETSPCIDAGMEASDYSNEPLPNGDKVNLGAFGNTSEASKSPAPLPLEWSYFKIQKKSNDALLSWATENEINVLGFDIFRSFDGTGWQRIGHVNASGCPNTLQKYEFVDNNVNANNYFSEMIFYHIRYRDLDNRKKWSKIVSISMDKSGHPVLVFPNPTHGKIYLSDHINCQSYKILNTFGVVVKSGKLSGNSIDLGSLDNGIYQINFANNKSNECRSFKVVKE